MAKNDNMLAILWMLNSGAKITAKQISERLEINIRSVYRYMDALCVSGVPIISEPGHNGGYSLLNNFIKAPLFFDIEEKKSLLHAATFAMEAGYPFTEALNSATSKLKMFSNQEQEKALNRHLVGFEVVSRICDPAVKPILMEIEQAVASECSMEIEYAAGYEGHPKHRVIDPYGMLYWNDKWYVIAFCHLRNEIRSFRVDRIVNIISTKNTFKRPEAFSAREFFTKSLLSNVESKVGLCTLVIEGRSEALNDLCSHWFLGHYLIERTECRAKFLMDENSIHTYVPHILLQYGKSMKVLEPNSFKDAAALILPGGNTWTEAIHTPVIRMAEKYLEKGIVVGAICGATIGLAMGGVLNKRDHTSNDLGYLKMVCPSYDGDKYYKQECVVTDGSLITASGIAPLEFALHVLKILEVFLPQTLDSWYNLYKTQDSKYFFELMNSIQ